ncbi:DUF1697 domain-containing protein [Modestobacter sp. Leaf380]|uniref:DUF1697 domain-containing protein n=1 Tax=Modestobacter sp. Leaf380 TaxID=1736356 RepID=UPI0006F9CAD1|nr:DUF1697 domain-containing protein [Modestobacter sp. Leaf380]KQS66938.1 hypothetical protein ASG41_11200 [Modestobacter sp. Leaf380]
MTRYVVLLRGINVGTARRIAMGPLREQLAARGHGAVRTHLTSGNVLLDSDLDEVGLAAEVRAAVLEGFGHDVPVVVRTVQELDALVAAGPHVEGDPSRYLVGFCDRTPDPDAVARVPAAGPDQGGWWLTGRELHLWCPDGVAAAGAVGGWPWDRLLGVLVTARNWRTVTRLTEPTRTHS